MERAQRTCGSFSSVHIERRSDDSCVQLIAFRWLDPLATHKCQLQTHMAHLQANFRCDGICRRFCCIHVDSLCLCPLRRHEETSTGSPDLCPRTHLVGRRLHLKKNLERSRACDTLTTLRCSSNRNQSRKRNRGHPNVPANLRC